MRFGSSWPLLVGNMPEADIPSFSPLFVMSRVPVLLSPMCIPGPVDIPSEMGKGVDPRSFLHVPEKGGI